MLTWCLGVMGLFKFLKVFSFLSWYPLVFFPANTQYSSRETGLGSAYVGTLSRDRKSPVVAEVEVVANVHTDARWHFLKPQRVLEERCTADAV